MALTYTSYVAQVSNLMVQDPTDANFLTMLPGMIDFAEQRIYRELDLQVTRIVDTTTVSSASRNLDYPTVIDTFLVVEQINIITPSTALSSNGTRNPLTMVTKEYLDFAWPSAVAN